ncbi:MAG: 2-hydroxyacyl-CoA dehydratase [Dehalococcoidia bacterium]|jgi:benzoyl-CoA reductase/2-hydroxyglutaryl-CoA dehydratase subunit BcrC/BadD/HgdB
MKKIGITTTVPLEVLLAAGYQPVDLNNIFISDDRTERLVSAAEKAGFPLNCCSWIKGIYGTVMEHGIDTVLGVTTGDCSNTLMLMEVLKLRGVRTIPFAYPDKPDPTQMQKALDELANVLGTTMEAADKVREQLKPCRELAWKLDEMTWKDNLVGGYENHLWLVSASDFNRDYGTYQRELGELIEKRLAAQPYPQDYLRIAFLGVPSVYGKDLYNFLEKNGARVVYNEIQRQFAMPHPGKSLAEQYSRYTYPYSVYDRLEDIQPELEKRRVDGVIHYVQAFCHRGIGDIIFRDAIELPILTLEGNDDFTLTQHLKTRVEAFVDMLQRQQRKTKIAQGGIKQ